MSTLFNSLGALAVIAIAVLQFDSAFYTKPYGHLVVLSLAAFAALCVVTGAVFTFLEGRKREQREFARDAVLEALAAKAIEGTRSTQVIGGDDQSLKRKVMALAHDLFGFLREKGPEPEAAINDSMTTREKLAGIVGAMWPYNERVHHGYQHRFRQRVIDIFHELAECGIPPGLEPWEIDSEKAGTSAETVRKIAERLILIAAKMDIADQSKGT